MGGSSLGDRIRSQYAKACETDPSTEALVIEAVRIIERLDELDGIISGRNDFLELMHFRLSLSDSDHVTVTMDNALAESRQQANALRQIIGQLQKSQEGSKSAESPKGKAVNPIDEIRARRAARGGATSRLGEAQRGAS